MAYIPFFPLKVVSILFVALIVEEELVAGGRSGRAVKNISMERGGGKRASWVERGRENSRRRRIIRRLAIPRTAVGYVWIDLGKAALRNMELNALKYPAPVNNNDRGNQ